MLVSQGIGDRKVSISNNDLHDHLRALAMLGLDIGYLCTKFGHSSFSSAVPEIWLVPTKI